MVHRNRIFGGTLLVSGTTIGAAMLALPVATGIAGFYPSLIAFFFIWLYLTTSAFLLLEVNLWMKPNSNLITMAQLTLGRAAQALTWIFYLFLLYALTTAYLAGSAPIFSEFFHTLTGYHLPKGAAMLPLMLFFGYFVYRGTSSVDNLNRILMAGLALTYGIIVWKLMLQVDFLNYYRTDWEFLPLSLSVIVTSFGFHVIIPTLSTYMEHNVKELTRTIMIGSLIPLTIYILWQYVMLGIVPVTGTSGIAEGYIRGNDVITLVIGNIGESWIATVARFLAVFTITTSFLGVSMSLLDCLSDGFKIQKSETGRELLWALTFIPPLIIALVNPRAFLSALEYAGAFGVVTLLGLLPALMAWSGRYRKGFTGPFRTPGGKPMLLAVIFTSFLLIAIETAHKLGYAESVRVFINRGG